MRTIIFAILMAVSIVSLFNPEVRAQEKTHKIMVYVDKHNFILTDQTDTVRVHPGNAIQFYTNGPNTYRVTVNNKNGFFNIDTEVLQFSIDRSHPRAYVVGNPTDYNWANIAPIEVVNQVDPQPIPTAPPRIIVAIPE